MLRVASLCTGAGGLELALQEVFGGVSLVFMAENDPGCRKILEHRFPGVPNLGDLREINWSSVKGGDLNGKPADIDMLTAGFPLALPGRVRGGEEAGAGQGYAHRIVERGGEGD